MRTPRFIFVEGIMGFMNNCLGFRLLILEQ